MALAILIGFSGYLRPCELTSLAVSQLVAPNSFGGRHFKHWTLAMRPDTEGLRSKAGTFDGSIHIDTEYMTSWIAPFLATLSLGRPAGTPLWPFSHAELIAKFRAVSDDCGLTHMKLCLYALRHGGASHDALHALRTMAQVKERGRWSTDRSLVRP